MNTHLRRALILAGLIVVAVLLKFVNDNAVTGDNNTSEAKPDGVERLIPESGSSVLLQDQVGIDLKAGYQGYLIINDVEISNVVDRADGDGLFTTPALGLIVYQPAAGHRIEQLTPGENCVTAIIWKPIDGRSSAKPVRWCFNAG